MSSFKVGLLATAIAMSLVGCGSLQLGSKTQIAVEKLSSQLQINYKIETNHGGQEGIPCKKMGADWASCSRVIMTLTNNGGAVNIKDWKIYLHSIRVILAVENKDFTIKHETGDLYVLTPKASFDGFSANEKIEIPLISEYWQLFETDFMPRAYLVAGDVKPQVIKSTDTEVMSSFVDKIDGDKWKRVPEDNNVLATAASRYVKNSDVTHLPSNQIDVAIVPTPLRTKQMKMDLKVGDGFAIRNRGLSADKLSAFMDRATRLGVNTNGEVELNIDVDPDKFKGKEAVSGAYKLVINLGGVSVVGYDDVGAFYGLQSFLALMHRGGNSTLPMLIIEDAPRFEYRGVMVDVARNFHSKDAIKRTLDQMAAYKLNKLHLHLTDDEGWRLQIPGIPELTSVGGKRCHDLSETNCLLPQLGSGPDSDNMGSGFFTKADYIELLNYAKDRGIEVIPEIDMPAHSRAAVVSMEARFKKYNKLGDKQKAEQYRLMDPKDTSNVTTVQFYDKRSFINPCLPSSISFVNKVITEVRAMHEEARMPLTTWHFGGDEAKNIKLNPGYEDINAKEPSASRGTINQRKEDKPFAKSPVCQKLIKTGVVKDYGHLPSYFAERVSELVGKHGIKNFQAWQDGLKYSKDAKAFKTDKTRVNFWDVLYWGGDASAYDWADKGYDVIVSNPDYLYMDMPYEVDPKERGYYWATRASDSRKMFGFAPENLPQNAETSVDRDGNGFKGKGKIASKGFHGMSAQLWSESVRTDNQYEYMVFPRVLAVAERAWHKGDWEEDYQVGREFSQNSNFVDDAALLEDWIRFANTLGQKELAKMDAAGIQYRVPLPGAIIEGGKLYMNISMPGLPMQYSLDNGRSWKNYSKPVAVKNKTGIKIRALTPDKSRKSRESSI